jgi:hypothetical protein
MNGTRTEKLQVQRNHLATLLDDLAPKDPSRPELQGLIADIDRLIKRDTPRTTPKPHRRGKATTEPDSCLLIATVPKSERTEIRICLKFWEGRQIVDLRLYARGRVAEYKATGKGVSFDPGDLGAVLSGLALAQQYAPGKLEP